MVYSFVYCLLFCSSATAAALKNITIPLPQGSSDHGTAGLLCTPTQWTDLAAFYLFNNVAHAATVLNRPGERSTGFAVTIVGCLFLPPMGLYRGIEAILSGAIFSRCSLRRAARAGVLCMLVRSSDWRPIGREEIRNAILRPGDNTKSKYNTVHLCVYLTPWSCSKFGLPVCVHGQTIQGGVRVPDGYHFAIVPPDASFVTARDSETSIGVASTYNIVKALVALAQTGYASLTLYRSRGDQIQEFGYAAFGLIVAPYAVMSIVNLLGNICRPDYASLYMVESSIMVEARGRGGWFEGTITALEEEPNVVVHNGNGRHLKSLQFSQGVGCRITTRCVLQSSALEHRMHNLVISGCTLDNKETLSPPASSTPSSLSRSVWRLADPPLDRDYTGTEYDDLILIPSCNPLKLSHHPEEAPFQFIAKTKLKRIVWFKKRRHWAAEFDDPFRYYFRFRRWRVLKYFLTIFISLTPILIIGIMSHFKHGSAKIAKQTLNGYESWIIQWLVFGVASGTWFAFKNELSEGSAVPRLFFRFCWTPAAMLIIYISSATAPIGGLVSVGQMLSSYGSCVRID